MSNDGPRNSLLAEYYSRYATGRDSASFIKQVSLRYTPATLERLAKHDARDVRRAAILALSFLGDYSSNATMGRALVDTDRGVRTLAESGIRSIWRRDGNETQRQQLSVSVRLNASKQFEEAIQVASALITEAPWFAEAWNQRAIAFASTRQFAQSIRDCHQTLELNPYHFGAAAGMGQCYLELGNHISALESFRRALRLNPNLERIRAHVVRLQRSLEQD